MSGCAKRRMSVSLSDLRLASDQESRNNLLDDLFAFGLKEAERLSDISLWLLAETEAKTQARKSGFCNDGPKKGEDRYGEAEEDRHIIVGAALRFSWL